MWQIIDRARLFPRSEMTVMVLCHSQTSNEGIALLYYYYRLSSWCRRRQELRPPRSFSTGKGCWCLLSEVAAGFVAFQSSFQGHITSMTEVEATCLYAAATSNSDRRRHHRAKVKAYRVVKAFFPRMQHNHIIWCINKLPIGTLFFLALLEGCCLKEDWAL